jgi:pimeloyl-ACP methyl ester carboxylesterase
MADSQAFIALTGAHGIRIAASEHGSRDGFPVVLSHGDGQTRFAWGRADQAMADRGFHVLSLDLKGHGDSACVGSGSPYDISDYAEDVSRFAATLSRPPLLVGASLGGLAPLIAAGEPPYADIAGQCLVDVSPHLRASQGAEAELP